MGTTFSELSAEERARALADPGTLARLEAASAGASTVFVGGCRIDGHDVFLALTDGHRRGGTVGVAEAKVLGQWAAAASGREIDAVIVCWDTGGVRVEEGPLALATASAAGVALARLAIEGPPVLSVISGPRGCFGAPSVIAALSSWVGVIDGVHWGLTGPKLLEAGRVPASEASGLAATAAANRVAGGDADTLLADSAEQVRAALAARLAKPSRPPRPAGALDRAVIRGEERLHRTGGSTVPTAARRRGGGRDFLRFSFRGQWQPTGPRLERGLVSAAWGRLGQGPALGIILGAARGSEMGIGTAEAHAVAEMVRFAAGRPGRERAPILVFIFCQGHAVDVDEERRGLHAALADCMLSLVAARLRGHRLVSVLGGGAYGAAYLALAAPSQRILAIRGTTVAPMAPRVLTAFRRLKGLREERDTASDMADLIPEIEIVDSVVRLPRALAAALAEDTPAGGGRVLSRRRR